MQCTVIGRIAYPIVTTHHTHQFMLHSLRTFLPKSLKHVKYFTFNRTLLCSHRRFTTTQEPLKETENYSQQLTKLEELINNSIRNKTQIDGDQVSLDLQERKKILQLYLKKKKLSNDHKLIAAHLIRQTNEEIKIDKEMQRVWNELNPEGGKYPREWRKMYQKISTASIGRPPTNHKKVLGFLIGGIMAGLISIGLAYPAFDVYVFQPLKRMILVSCTCWGCDDFCRGMRLLKRGDGKLFEITNSIVSKSC